MEELIADEIARHGPLTFARFMDLALYAPGCGYYAGGRLRTGRAGDFFTSVSVGKAFGRTLAAAFEQVWRSLGTPPRFLLVEQGALDGALMADVLDAAAPDFRAAVAPVLVEPVEALRAVQSATLAAHAPRWVAAVEELPMFTGIHFSNELVDAMPFHLLVAEGGRWRELFVNRHEGSLRFEPGEPAPEAAQAAGLLPARPDGFLAEVRPAADRWIKSLARRLTCGAIIVFDYGLDSAELLERPRGTFACYRGHRRDENPLEAPGSKDITAHVDFGALARAAEGLAVHGPFEQGRFLVRAAELLLRSMDGAMDPAFARGFQTLIRPECMGRSFRVMTFLAGPARELAPAFLKAA